MENIILIKQQKYINKTPESHHNQTTKQKINKKKQFRQTKTVMIQEKLLICSKMWSGKKSSVLVDNIPGVAVHRRHYLRGREDTHNGMREGCREKGTIVGVEK